jgi:hypothetical protein
MNIPNYDMEYVWTSEDDDADILAIKLKMDGVVIGQIPAYLCHDLDSVDAFLRLAFCHINRCAKLREYRAHVAEGNVVDLVPFLETVNLNPLRYAEPENDVDLEYSR